MITPLRVDTTACSCRSPCHRVPHGRGPAVGPEEEAGVRRRAECAQEGLCPIQRKSPHSGEEADMCVADNGCDCCRLSCRGGDGTAARVWCVCLSGALQFRGVAEGQEDEFVLLPTPQGWVMRRVAQTATMRPAAS